MTRRAVFDSWAVIHLLDGGARAADIEAVIDKGCEQLACGDV